MGRDWRTVIPDTFDGRFFREEMMERHPELTERQLAGASVCMKAFEGRTEEEIELARVYLSIQLNKN